MSAGITRHMPDEAYLSAGTGSAALWAKTGARSRMPGVRRDDWHPLTCHMIDSAAVAAFLWDEFLAPATRAWLGVFLGGEKAARGLVCKLAGLHDWGKATPVFQSQSQVHAAAVRGAGLEVPAERLPQGNGHAHLSAHLLLAALNEAGWDEEQAVWPAAVIAGHHGMFPPAGWRRDRPLPAEIGGGAWRIAQRELGTLVSSLSFVGEGGTGAISPPPLPVQVVVAGLVILADWLASSESLFPYECGYRDGYAARAAERAARVAGGMGVRRIWAPSGPPVPAVELMKGRFSRDTARVIQRAAWDLAHDAPGPGLLLVEAPMGEGKTEAALLAAEVIAARCGAAGLFVGLPTQATANQMFGRVTRWLESQGGATVALAHGKARRNDEYLRLMPACIGFGEHGADGDKAEVTASQWLAGPKRTLLAPVVVGTVDQLLLAGVASRHVALRLLGLAGKVVVIDEVHAYDAYMSVILHRVLAWLGAARVPVILLSATLPASARGALLSKYAGAEVPVLPARYPLLSWIGAPEPQPALPFVPEWQRGPLVAVRSAEPLVRTPAATRSVSAGLELVAEAGEQEAAVLAGDLAATGGCVLLLRNTVGRAQRSYDLLARRLGRDRVTLAHARFTAADRRERDRVLADCFGPDAGDRRPGTHVVVATQVAEQSLDIDFDVLVSDLAPVDLLLQRLGRVHRHDRARPPHLSSPRMVIVGHDPQPDGPPELPAGSEWVYGRHLLWRTAAVLLGRDHVRLPADIPGLVEAVYGEESIGPAHWQDALDAARAEFLARLGDLEAAARTVTLPEPGATDLWEIRSQDQGEPIEESDGRVQAHVRFGPPTIEVVLLRATADPHHAVTVSAGRQAIIPLGAAPSPEQADKALDQVVRLPAQLTEPAIRAATVPGHWRRSPELSESRLLLLPADGSPLHVGGYECGYSPELGFEVGRRA